MNFLSPNVVLGTALATTVNGNTLTTGSSTYTGSAGKTYTFPTTTATIARTDAAQTFVGTQTFSGAVAANSYLSMLGTTPVIYAGNATHTTSLTIQNNNSNTITSGTVIYLKISPSYNQVSATTSNTDFLLNRVQTNIGSGTQLLMDLQVGGVSKFNVSNAGSQSINISNVATTNVYGLKVGNPTAAAVGAVQFSPAISLQSNTWNTTTGTSRPTEWRMYNKAIQSTIDYSQLWFGYSFNGGAFTDTVAFDFQGGISSSLGFSIPGKLQMSGGTNDGDVRLTAISGSGFGKLQLGGPNSAYPAIGRDGTTANVIVLDAGGTYTSSLGIGVSATARLTLPAGTTTALSAPMQFTAGVFETTARSGLLETDSTNDLAYTNSSLTRKYIITSSNKISLAGTDGTIMTFPSTSATIARTDASQTFSGTQTLSTLKYTDGNQATNSILTGASDGTATWKLLSAIVGMRSVLNERFTGSTSSTITLANGYIVGQVAVYKNGIRMDTIDYTASNSTTITLLTPRIAEDVFLIDSKY